ncbi:MAG: alpha/beta hydrolase [Bacillaceae bacterium]
MLATIITSITIFGGLGYLISHIFLLPNFNKSYRKDPVKRPLIEEFQSLVNELKGEKLTITSPYGYHLIGYYFPAAKPSHKTIITVHGYRGSKDHHGKYVKLFHSLGFNVIAYDHRNHGESAGNFITYGILESGDLKAVVDYAKAHFPSDQLLGIHGVSMGAATTLLYAGKIEDGADFYVVDCPYSNFFEQTRYRLQKYRFLPSLLHKPLISLGNLFVKWRERYSIYDASPITYIHRIKAPTLFINTKKDMYIPPMMTQELYELKRGSKDIYWTDEGDHAKAYEVNPTKYKQAIKDFLTTYFHEKKA